MCVCMCGVGLSREKCSLSSFMFREMLSICGICFVKVISLTALLCFLHITVRFSTRVCLKLLLRGDSIDLWVSHSYPVNIYIYIYKFLYMYIHIELVGSMLSFSLLFSHLFTISKNGLTIFIPPI